MEPGDEYLKGNFDLGCLGKQRVTILPNEEKQGNQPDHYVYIRSGDDLKRCGALWINEKKSNKDVKTKEQDVV